MLLGIMRVLEGTFSGASGYNEGVGRDILMCFWV